MISLQEYQCLVADGKNAGNRNGNIILLDLLCVLLPQKRIEADPHYQSNDNIRTEALYHPAPTQELCFSWCCPRRHPQPTQRSL